ncbi:MAG: FAD-dependent oxidoreductase [Candidatus Nanogingivalaceae bacterium]|jgi:FAD-dependent pyridine nucleotide-disulphide oxidoreductase|nr:FAD-dependent oxidoreductase [Candidatus Nanogingivalaceae bacterium]
MEDIKSVVMVGAGPSALAAAIYTTREGIDTTLYEKGVIGGLAAITDKIDNYPGFPEGVPGMELADNLRKQAERFGAKIEYGDVSALRHQDGVNVLTVDGKDIKARTVLIATGSDYKKLGVPGEAEFYGRGVHYCATCDGAFYKGKRLVVVGGGNSGVQEAMFLTRFAEHIDLLVRSTIKASKTLQDDLQKYIDNGKITVHLQTVAQEIVSKDDAVASVRALKDGTETVFEADGVFVFIGLKPNTQFLADSGVEFDEYGLVKTNNHLATNLPGVFASGDVRSGATMQVASAVGEGATAALSIREYLESVK